ncbi:MAG TPA: extracellular solute-binding protein, partial [Limnochordia bacterium]
MLRRYLRSFSVVASMTATAVLSLGAAASAGAVLRVMDWKLNETQATQAWFQSVKERFEAEHPGVEVQLETAAWGEEYRQKVLTGVAAGTAPDVVSLSIVWARDLFEAGALLDLTPFIRRTPEVAPNQFVPVTQLYNQVEGRFFGITNAMDEAALLYDVDAFDQAGIDSSPDAIGSWEEFRTIAQKLTRVDGSGNVTYWGYSGGTGLEAFNSWLVANGGSFYTEDLNAPAFQSRNGFETAQFIADLFTVYRVIGGSVTSRTAAMGHAGNWTP